MNIETYYLKVIQFKNSLALIGLQLLPCLVITCFLFQTSTAQITSINRLGMPYDLSPSVTILPNSSNYQTLDQVLPLQNSFLPISSITEAFRPHEYYWFKVEVENLIDDPQHLEWILHFSLIFTDLEVYVLIDELPIQTSRSGFFTPLKDRTFSPTNKANLAKIQLPPNKKAQIILRGISNRNKMAPKFEVAIWSEMDYFDDLKERKQGTALFIGFVTMMLIYNLFLYFYARDKTYIHYSIYLTGIVAFTSYNSGNLADWLQPTFFPVNPEKIYIFKVTMYLALLGYSIFIRSFLDLKKLLPKWDFILKSLSIMAVFMGILDFIILKFSNVNYDLADSVAVSFSFIFVATLIIFLFPLYKTKDKKAYFIIAGVFFMNLGILLTIFDRFRTVDFSTNFFKIGAILEIIIFSLGLAYRQKLLEREKQEAAFELEITKLREAEEHREAERLKELNNLKSKLYTNITHEFRTPLTVIMGMAENLEVDSEPKNLIVRNSENLLRLINQMLDLAKAEDGKLEIDWVQADIVEYLQYLTESFLSHAMDHKVRLAFYPEIKEKLMDFDETKIQQIVNNLLSNAIKFTPPNGSVIFHLVDTTIENKEFLQIKIKDTGIGIKEEDLPHIFDRFHQGHHAKGGTGIGLALSKELVQLLGGTISVISSPESGSVFTVLLPINNEAPLKDLNLSLSEKTVSSKLEPIASISTIEEIESPNGKPQLLLVEDNADVVRYIQSLLSPTYEISIAKNGKEGIELALTQVPDIIISDVMMPEKDGYEVCEFLKGDERTSHIPIILLTAKADFKDKIEGLKVGADAYLTKPFRKEEMMIRLEKLITLRQELQKHFSDTIKDSNLSNEKEPATSLEDQFLQKIEQIISDNIENVDFSIEDLSQTMSMSYIQVYRKIKALTGRSPSLFIRAIRLKKALHLLQTTEHNISEVAYQVGFNDPNYFSRSFQQEYGYPPSHLKK